MKKKLVLTSGFLVLILAVILGGINLYDKNSIGKEIDSYKNVQVYYNGIIYFKSYGKNHSANGYYYGQKWQCVEYIKRFFFEVYNHKMPDVYGHAKDFFDTEVTHGKVNKKRGLLQFNNGGDIRPEKDDLIVFNDTKYGHVAIISESNDKFIEVVQQNIYGKTRERHSLIQTGKNFFVGKDRQPAGWLRKPIEPKRITLKNQHQ